MRSTLVRLSAGLVLPALALIGAYGASPYVAVHNFVSIAKSGDIDQIDAAVDFPRVRESLKAQFVASLAAHMSSDPELKDNPFASLGMMMAPAVVDRMVDAVITPEGIASMVRAGKTGKSGVSAPPSNPDVKVSSSYVTLDRFKTTITNKVGTTEPIMMTFERKGLFGWRLIRVELPMPSENGTTPAGIKQESAAPFDDPQEHTLTTPSGASDDPASSEPPLAVEPAEGAELPSYDHVAYCAKIGDAAGGSNVIERSCREQEARAQSEARAMSIPAKMISYCDKIGRVAGGSYQIFKSCAEQELAAALPSVRRTSRAREARPSSR